VYDVVIESCNAIVRSLTLSGKHINVGGANLDEIVCSSGLLQEGFAGADSRRT